MELRKVLYKKWIDLEFREYEKDGWMHTEYLPDTNCWQKNFENTGLFHRWGDIKYEDGSVVTFALVEITDGTIEHVLPCNLKFI
jgi:hypothetical protein